MMGPLAERYGVRSTVIFGAVSICIGLMVSTLGETWQLYIGHGIFIGLLGTAGLNAPLYIYVSRWFDRRRGSARTVVERALPAGHLAASVQRAIAARMALDHDRLWRVRRRVIVHWRSSSSRMRRRRRAPPAPLEHWTSQARTRQPLAWCSPCWSRLVPVLRDLSCRRTIWSLCTDSAIRRKAARRCCRCSWGSALAGRCGRDFRPHRRLADAPDQSLLQGLAMTGFVVTQDELGLYGVAAAFGAGFSALIPAYVLAVREYFPAREASWRVPIVLLLSGSGMATGTWLAGALYDYFGFYAPAFAVGVGFNILNFIVIATLVLRRRSYLRAIPA
jgi:MFS family permease